MILGSRMMVRYYGFSPSPARLMGSSLTDLNYHPLPLLPLPPVHAPVVLPNCCRC